MKLSNLNLGTLHDALLACGFTHRPAAGIRECILAVTGRRDIIDPDGRVVFTGNWHTCWAWLRATHDLGGAS